jgi:single-strand DNA-binding protein
MNVCGLVGRLTRDPELRYTPSGIATATFTLAVDDPFAKGEKKADFIPIVVWRQQAEACANYLRKGRLCAVEGRISTRNYDGKDGKKVYVTEIVASNVRFLESSKTDDNGRTVGNHAEQRDPFQDDGKPIEISDDDLPF